MTTKPLSSPRVSRAAPTKLVDGVCTPLELGDELGRGGEGSVFELANDPSLVVKVYHKTPLDDGQLAKLHAMTAMWSRDLEGIAAWPRTILYNPDTRQPCGLLMSKMSGAWQLHELYGTTNRKRHFPDAGWHHLVLAARNVAAVFNTFHSAGIVVGDVNQGNLLVDSKMTVRMIDCDSFQITHGGQTYNCPVGSPHFTPPELQGMRLRDVRRTEDHDRFGLATLIFHLLFVGRHPFAGRYRGSGDMSIEKAIGERRFAFSHNKAATMVDPPPDSLLLDDLPPAIGELFEAAFRTEGNPRPTPTQWIEHLEQLIKLRRTCKTDKLHVYSASARECPWCRIEDRGGPSFFFAAGADSAVSFNRLARLERKVDDLEEVSFPELLPERLVQPRLPPVTGQKPLKSWGTLDAATAVLIASWAASIIGMFISPYVLIATSVMSVASASYLVVEKRARESRALVDKLRRSLAKQEKEIDKLARTINRQHRNRLGLFEESRKEFEQEKRNYRAEREELVKVIVESRNTQLDDFLREHSIRDHYRSINGLTLSHVAQLESYGVESAFDLARLKLYGVPNVDSNLVIELLNWGSQVKRKFEFKPEHGVTLDNLKSLGESSVQRFKMSQAKKIVMGDERLRMLAESGKEALEQALAEFDESIRRWRKTGKQLWSHENSRSVIERAINRAPAAMIIAPALAVPAVAWLLHSLM